MKPENFRQRIMTSRMNGYKLKVNYTTVSGLKMAMDGSEIDEIQMQAEQIAEDIRAKIERQIIR